MSENPAESNSKKIGWFCSFVPEELFLAAGLAPVRLYGRVDKVKEADAYAAANLCPYMKNLLDSGLRNKFGDMSGFVFSGSCDGMRRLYDLWTHYVPSRNFTYMLEVPRNQSEEAVIYFADRLLDLKTRLESEFGVDVSDDKLTRSIARMNEHRRLIAEIHEGQKETPPYLRGSEILSLLSREAARPKEETFAHLRDLLGGRTKARPGRERRPRIMVAGNLIHGPALFEMVEGVNGSVVIYDACNGLKHYTGLVDESTGPLEALARRYLLKPSCLGMPGIEARLERLWDLIREYMIEGVIYSSLKFCDFSLFETPQVEEFLRDKGVPVLVLENDYVWGDIERQRIRVEAFLEVVGPEF